MKKLTSTIAALLLCCIVSFGNSFATSENVLPISTVRITAVNTASGQITLTNQGTTTFDVSTYWLCDQPSYSQLSSITPTSGDYVLDANESVTLVWGSIAGAADAELALYNTNTFGNSAAVEDYMQWGSDPHGRTDEAVSAGVWVMGEFVATAGDWIFTGGISDYGSTFWEMNVPGCTDPAAANYNSLANNDDNSCLYNATFNVDMNCETGFTSVNISGPYVSWCDNCLPLADIGGGIWSATFQLPAGPFEYKYQVDDFASQEDLVDDMVAGGTCAPVTDFSSYANRLEDITADVVFDNTYGTCGTCTPGAGCMDSGANNFDSTATSDDGSCLYDVDFSVDMNCESGFSNVNVTGPFVGWCANCLPLTDGDADGFWTGTFSLPAMNFEYKYNVDDFAGQEDLVDDMVAGGTCAPITDFDTYANRELVIVAGAMANDTYDSCDPCVPGDGGCMDVDAANYDSTALTDDGSCLYNVSFTVDMNCHSEGYASVGLTSNYVGWCGNCLPLTDMGGGIWGGTHAFPAGPWEFLYNVDGPPGQENLIDDMIAGGTCAPVTDFASYANREVTVAGPLTVTSGTYGQCDACVPGTDGCTDSMAVNYDSLAMNDDGTCEYEITFNVDMNCESGFSNVNVTGPFVGWCADCLPLTDGDGDGIWSGTFIFPTMDFEYKYQVDNFATQEDLVDDMVAGGSCAPITDFATYANRTIFVEAGAEANDTYGTCGTCLILGCTYDQADNYNPNANDDDGSCVFSCCDAFCPGDTDGNNVVNIIDLVNVSGNFGSTCP